jgi:pectate lyase
MLKASEVEAAVKANAGATLKSPTECDANYVEPEPPTPDKQFQAETGTITGGVSESSNGGYHGDGYVNFDKGGNVVVNVKVDTAGQYRFDIDFANGSSEARSLAISAGLDTATTSFKTTGGWTVWETAEVLVNLATGENAVKFATVGGNDGPNIDQFDVTLVKAAEKDTTEKPTSIHTKTAAVVEPSVYRVDIFDTKGALVRRMNVESEKVGDGALMTRGLPAGLYVMQLKSAGTERRKFIAVK